MNSESEDPRTNSRLWVCTVPGTNPGQQEPGKISEGKFVTWTRLHIEREGAVGALVLFPVAGVAPGQRAERHHSRHEAEIGVCFVGRNKLVHLVGLGEVVPRGGDGWSD